MEKNLVIDGKNYRYHRQEKKITELDIIAFLSVQELYPKMYLSPRFPHEERIALGSILSLEHLPSSFEGDEDVRLYGGQAFSEDLKDSNVWEDFPRSRYFLPKYEIVQTHSETILISHSINESKINPCKDLIWDTPSDLTLELRVEHSENFPELESWVPLIEKTLSEIEQGSMEKVVLARMTTLKTNSPIHSYAILAFLKEKKLNTTVFSLEFAQGSVFLGSSPEKLYSRVESLLLTEALAGTFPRGISKMQDIELESCLQKSPKDLNEVCFVGAFLKELLSPLSSSLKEDAEFSILQTPKVQHLYKKFSCELKKPLSDRDLLEALHPTPAVGGTPRDKALSYIKENEPFDRGWYAGPIGWISPVKSDIVVAIRSAFIKEDTIHLFAGAGIVKGSIPLKEWEELDNKTAQFTELLYAKR
ncbi:MAG: isochorismate synthase [Chlamydiae bacterium]|nr:isochorismate synthase [Chlamydiota bacterium]